MRRPGRAFIRYAPVTFLEAFMRFMRDPFASLGGKLLVAGTVAYIGWSRDLIPDTTPRTGWLDDMVLTCVAGVYAIGRMIEYRERSTFTG